jgi:hypothetical protein
MTDSELHPYVELIAREAKRPVVTDAAAKARIMAAVRVQPIPRHAPVWQRLLEPRAFTISPLRTGLIAAGLVGIGLIAGVTLNNRGVRNTDGQPHVAFAPTQSPVSPDTVVKFVYVAPSAKSVYVVGDFNDWDATKTPMVRTATDGAWTASLPMAAGRHLYGFLVDGTWMADPTAPRAPDDGFGRVSSVKLVHRGSSL